MVKKSVVYIHLGRFKREIRKRSFRFPLLNLHVQRNFSTLRFNSKCSGRWAFMAGKPVFPLSYKQVVAAINDYKHKVETGEYPKADWWHFCGTIGMDAESVSKAIKSPPANKMDVARELKKFATWIRGQYNTAPGWSGPNSSKSIFANKQDFDGCKMIDKAEDGKSSGELTINIEFGGSKTAFK